jgi:uncharacterized protein YukE
MAVIKINVSETLDCVNNALKEIDEQDSIIKQVADNITSLDGEWESETKLRYVENFHKSRAEMERFNDTQRSYFKMMQTFADECSTTDNAVRDLLKSTTW